ncbi:DMT family transporter [Propionicimonas sp.]|uniref:DMT family transporter n=1 Tax=Propionicimonas sp. TaxID=1955623 RepID=UPI0017FA89C5|nr:DMT family transporter [Propionicimonas sp.]MBU3975377.1 DMT family transporter [Actinomycetota bacterium]MBA3020217.1 DMT family transporter [Propionicimonas sp.]MBU3986474.1 DMT family transporter [Actinomycetota bacterium]MBU4008043.1 DMT family transporter [Actinomycetota bacterium]MBU4064301.1 DMT family transporter [Actinomycetota bacterium]
MGRRFARNGALAGLAAAALFGAGTPVAKLLLGQVGPWLLAGLLYTAAGLALFGWRLVRRSPRVHLAKPQLPWLIGVVFFGGLAGPLLLMFGLASMPASGASLLLNAEALFTALIAWLVFREATDRRIVAGFVLIAAGAVVLSWPGQAQFAGWWPTAAVLAACLSWAIDNNLTQRLALTDATWLAAVKGTVAGPVNLLLAFILGAQLPAWPALAGAAAIGVLSYGVSLALFITALGLLGTARAGAYFSVAPFFGATLAILLGDPITWTVAVAAALMALGVLLHLRERHGHWHSHPAQLHEHRHAHDDGHHGHRHDPPVPPGVWHSHPHDHEPVTHTHEHFPDAGHRHQHRGDGGPPQG